MRPCCRALASMTLARSARHTKRRARHTKMQARAAARLHVVFVKGEVPQASRAARRPSTAPRCDFLLQLLEFSHEAPAGTKRVASQPLDRCKVQGVSPVPLPLFPLPLSQTHVRPRQPSASSARARKQAINSTARSRARTRTHRAPFRPCHTGGASARFSLLGLLPALPCPRASPLSSPSSTITMTFGPASPPGCCRACSFVAPPPRPDAAAPARRRLRLLTDPHPPSSSPGDAVRSTGFMGARISSRRW